MVRGSFLANADMALEFIDRLVYIKTGKRLNNLERRVFLGSWQGKTYKEIHPPEAEYIENYVAYRLWQRLSDILGEKVTQKKLRIAVERAIKQQNQIAIIHRANMPDVELAKTLGQAIQAAGYQIFLADLDTIPTSGNIWTEQIESDLTYCAYLILLLSPQMAASEMVIEVLHQIWNQGIDYYNHKPWLLALHIRPEPPFYLNHDLRNYIAQARHYIWKEPEDERELIRDLMEIIQVGNPPPIISCASDNNVETSKSSLYILEQPREQPSHFLIVPPSPVAEPELQRGQVRLTSAFYIERFPQDSLCHREVLNPGSLIRIKAPRQMGKTSLMARILYKAEERGYRTIPLSFQHADQEIFSNLEQLLRWLCVRVARKLHIPPRLNDFWMDTYGSKDNCTAYFEDYLLPEISTPLVLGMDEVDRVFQYNDIADDFFGLLRAWYEEAGYGISGSNLWEKLRLVIVHSTEGYVPLDINQSPFNVGLPIELKEFTLEQVTDLAFRHNLHFTTDQIEQLITLIGGHPYLVRRAFYHIVQEELTWNQLLQSAPTESGIYGDHLRRHLWNLKRNSVLAAAFNQVLVSQEPVALESAHAFKLHSLGLVKLEGNFVVPSFELYRQYFSERLQP